MAKRKGRRRQLEPPKVHKPREEKLPTPLPRGPYAPGEVVPIKREEQEKK
jgi:hypothetical protein